MLIVDACKLSEKGKCPKHVDYVPTRQINLFACHLASVFHRMWNAFKTLFCYLFLCLFPVYALFVDKGKKITCHLLRIFFFCECVF